VESSEPGKLADTSLKKLLLLVGLVVTLLLVGAVTYWQSGQSVLRRRDLARATIDTRQGLEILEQLAQECPNDAEVFLLRSRALRMRNQIGAAFQNLKRAEELGGPRVETDRERLLLSARADFAHAEPQLQALLDKDPNDRDALLALALGWTQAKNYKKAEALSSAILQRDPEDGFGLCLTGRLCLLQHAPFEARPALEKAFNHGADYYYYADARIMLAQCLLEIGNFRDALEYYRQCQAEEPDNVKVLLGIGRCSWHVGEWENATEAFRAILRLQPDHLDALSQLAYIEEERGEKQRALELLEQAVKYDPTWHELHFRIAKILLALGQKDRAAESLKQAEVLKKHWAKPRSGPANARNPYTGDDSARLREGTDN
jgi:tetratricopeptide (TPR) repeat protein